MATCCVVFTQSKGRKMNGLTDWLPTYLPSANQHPDSQTDLDACDLPSSLTVDSSWPGQTIDDEALPHIEAQPE